MNETDRSIATLYDTLLGSEPRKVAASGYAIHKRLHFPLSWRQQGIHDSNDWLAANLVLAPSSRILDAGCGAGGTLFSLLADDHVGTGLSLSGGQLELARAEATRRGLGERCRFVQGSYDEPVGGCYDLIVAIEALVHSQGLGRTIRVLSGQLAPAGQLVLLEDMATQDLQYHPQARILQQSWHLPSLARRARYIQHITENGLELADEQDFTPYVRARRWPGWLIAAGWHLAPRGSASAIFAGGLAQEFLYRNGLLRYRLVRAVKRPD